MLRYWSIKYLFLSLLTLPGSPRPFPGKERQIIAHSVEGLNICVRLHGSGTFAPWNHQAVVFASGWSYCDYHGL